jgi:hypothetical protein
MESVMFTVSASCIGLFQQPVRLGDDVAIEGKSPADLIKLALAGSGLELDGRRYSTQDLMAIVRALKSNCTLVVTNADEKTTSDLVALAEAAPGRVVFS